MSAAERRQSRRVVFEHPVTAQLMAIDGTWRRECSIYDVSEEGAKLAVGSSIEGLQLTEFFLVLSSTGLAYRRCKLAWVNGDQIGVTFLKLRGKKGARRDRDQYVN
ncbi:PilZ domain-containing protein [Bradyrhizobium sp.]|uniref:PilZ domain-containing protein n=1 Tax=Bradyrhizobium sp. TaxID=376 RepID=UPI001E08A56D|nr:PilZ domain-containing protein [Bradyrhizobium sp.]MBI5319512.1 PilZ domain-containing protein [Bradyrhizobium sp.]